MSVQSAAADVDVDLRQLFASLARNWLRILVVALSVTGLAFALAWLATPHYKAETQMQDRDAQIRLYPARRHQRQRQADSR